MMTFSEQERQELESCYQETRHRKVHIVLLRAKGVQRNVLVEMFGIAPQTVTNYCHLYRDKGVEGLLANNYRGRIPHLSQEQLAEVFLLQVGHIGHQHLGHVSGGADLEPILGRGQHQPAPELQRGLDAGRLGGADAIHLDNLGLPLKRTSSSWAWVSASDVWSRQARSSVVETAVGPTFRTRLTGRSRVGRSRTLGRYSGRSSTSRKVSCLIVRLLSVKCEKPPANDRGQADY